MGLARFVLFTSLGAGVWNAILAALGYYMASIPGMQTAADVMTAVKKYSSEIGIVFVVVAAAIVAYIVYQGFKKNR
jgi:membrane protein DedA with SNARE-associated domain